MTRIKTYIWIRAACLLAMLVLITETFLLMGVVTPVAIQGSSMAPTLLGPHVKVDCPNCELAFAVGADQLPGAWPVVCPNCRHQFHQTSPAPLNGGRRVWVDRTRFLRHPPQRHDIVVFRCPDQPTQLCVKRVIALPGEKVDFAGGDVTIDGAVLRKSLAQQNEVKHRMHRERDALNLWHPPKGDWTWQSDRWTHTSSDSGELQFIPVGGTVTDDLGMNQRASRPLSPLTDLMVTCDVSMAPNSKLIMSATFPIGTHVEAEPLVGSAMHSQRAIHWSLFDRQALLAVDGEIVSQLPRTEQWPGPPQLSIIASGDVTITRLSVWRDIYYHVRPADRWPLGGISVARQRYFVVGDNVAISSDSRNWASPGLPLRLIVGSPAGSIRHR